MQAAGVNLFIYYSIQIDFDALAMSWSISIDVSQLTTCFVDKVWAIN